MQSHQIYRLPIYHDYGMTTQGEIHSRQTIHVPAGMVPEGFALTQTDIARLGPFYFERLQRKSFYLIEVLVQGEGVYFTVFRKSATLLKFAPAMVEWNGLGGTDTYPIRGGLAANAMSVPNGALILSAHHDDNGLHVGMAIEGFYAWLGGGGTILPLRKWLYESTQAVIHHWLARDFVREAALHLITSTSTSTTT